MTAVREREPDLPDLDAERDVDLHRHWDSITTRWWLPVGGLVAGIIVGYLISLGGAQVYKAKATVYLGQPLSQGGVQVQSQATNPSTVRQIVTAESTIQSRRREGRPAPRTAARPHLDASRHGQHLAARSEPARRDQRHRPRAPQGGASGQQPRHDRGEFAGARGVREDEDPEPPAAGQPGEGGPSGAEPKPEGTAGCAGQRLRPLDRRAADRTRPAERPPPAAADDHRPAHHEPAAARPCERRRGAADHDLRRRDEDDGAQPPQHRDRRGA